MLYLLALLDCNFFYGILWAITELWYFILFLNQSFNSGQVALLGKERKEAPLSCCGLSLKVLIDKGTLYRWLKEFPLYCMQMTSFCQLQNFISSSFRDFCDFHPFELVQASELFPSPAFFQPDQSALITTEVPETLWITCCFSCLLMHWYLGKDYKNFILLFSPFLLKLNHPSQVFLSTQSSVSECEASGRGNWSNWIGLDKPAEQSHIPGGVSSIE